MVQAMKEKLSGFQQQAEQWWQQIALPYYQALPTREQRLLMLAAVLVPLMLLIFGISLPLHDAYQAKQKALLSMQMKVQEAESLAKQLQQQGGVKQRGNTMTVVDQLARANKVRKFMTRLRPQVSGNSGQRLMLQMRDAPYKPVVNFLSALSAQGVGLLQVKLQHAKQAGFVHVQAVVE